MTFEEFGNILNDSSVCLRHKDCNIYGLRCVGSEGSFITIDLDSERLIYCYQWDNLSVSLSPLELSVVLRALYKLQETPVEDRYPVSKYYIKVIANNSLSYLNYNLIGDRFIFNNNIDSDDFQTSFTKDEINELKKRDDIAIDWNKAIIKEVEQDD